MEDNLDDMAEIMEEINLENMDIWGGENNKEKEEEFAVHEHSKEDEIVFDDNNEPITNSMSVSANIMNIVLENRNIEIEELMFTLESKKIQTTRRYAGLRLKISKDLILLIEKKYTLVAK